MVEKNRMGCVKPVRRRRVPSARDLREEMDMPGMDEDAVRRAFMRPVGFSKAR